MCKAGWITIAVAGGAAALYVYTGRAQHDLDDAAASAGERAADAAVDSLASRLRNAAGHGAAALASLFGVDIPPEQPNEVGVAGASGAGAASGGAAVGAAGASGVGAAAGRN